RAARPDPEQQARRQPHRRRPGRRGGRAARHADLDDGADARPPRAPRGAGREEPPGMSEDKKTDDGPELEDAAVQPVPDKVIDSPETSTVDDPEGLRPAHTANIAMWQQLTDEEREPVQVGERRGMFGATRGQDTSGYGGLVTPTLLPGATPRPYG